MSKITLKNDDGSTVDFIQVVAQENATDEQTATSQDNQATGSEVANPQTETPAVAIEETPVATGDAELSTVEN